MNEDIVKKFKLLCVVYLDMSNQCDKIHEFKRIILKMCQEINEIIEEAEIDNDYKKSKRD